MKARFITVASGSNRITLPIREVEQLGWDEKTPLEFKEIGKRLIISEVQNEN